MKVKEIYLWPLGIEKSSFDCIIQCLVILLDFHIGCRSMLHKTCSEGQQPGFIVQNNSCVEISIMTGLITLTNFQQIQLCSALVHQDFLRPIVLAPKRGIYKQKNFVSKVQLIQRGSLLKFQKNMDILP